MAGESVGADVEGVVVAGSWIAGVGSRTSVVGWLGVAGSNVAVSDGIDVDRPVVQAARQKISQNKPWMNLQLDVGWL